jgi:predicted CoA-binding protein
MATFYVPARLGFAIVDEVAKKGIGEVWFNPRADSPELVARARALGLRAVASCSIVAIGESPAMY